MDDGPFLNLFEVAGAWLSISLVGPILVLRVIFFALASNHCPVFFNPFMLSGLFYLNSLDESISYITGV